MSEACPTCPREFDTKRGRSQHHRQAHGEKLTVEESECEVCGDTFEYHTSSAHRGRFCSDECSKETRLGSSNPNWSGEKEERQCDWCGNTFTKNRPSKEQRFCSRECYGRWRSDNVVGEDHPQFEGGRLYYGESWPDVRQRALKRDDYECQRCGCSPELLDVHHKTPVRQFDDPQEAHTMDNVVTLCRSCHSTVEAQND